jgi:hypothetical protein
VGRGGHHPQDDIVLEGRGRGEIDVRKGIAVGGLLVALACAPVAAAGANPSSDAYAGTAQQVHSALTAAPVRVQAASNDTGGGLPMTGMDLSVIGAAGLGLAGMGFALRRLAGRQEDRD